MANYLLPWSLTIYCMKVYPVSCPILCDSALFSNSDHWRKNIPVLARLHRVFSIDLIGYGYSDKPNPRDFGESSFYTFETWGTQINDFCNDVVKDKAFFICNSIGGVHLSRFSIESYIKAYGYS